MINKEINKELEMKRGDKITYTKQFMFGKVGEVTSTVVMVLGNKVLLDSGDELNLIDLQLKN
tara:strand:- start:15 stop:200 length:186 start_codon:yes stop_codon:yes gene_type:complete